MQFLITNTSKKLKNSLLTESQSFKFLRLSPREYHRDNYLLREFHREK